MRASYILGNIIVGISCPQNQISTIVLILLNMSLFIYMIVYSWRAINKYVLFINPATNIVSWILIADHIVWKILLLNIYVSKFVTGLLFFI